MRRCVCCLLLLLGLVSPTALALDEESAAQAAQTQSEAFGFDDLERIGEAYTGQEDIAGGVDVPGAFRHVRQTAKDNLGQVVRTAVRSCVLLLAVTLLWGLAQGMQAGAGESGGLEAITLAAVLAITAVAVGDVHSLLSLGEEAIYNMETLGDVLLPAVSMATAASGSPAMAVVKHGATILFSDFLLRLIHSLLIPLCYAFVAANVAWAALANEGLKRLAGFLKWLITMVLSVVLLVFVGYLNLSGVISGGADAATVKAAKFTLSNLVPVVGGVISDTAETLLAGHSAQRRRGVRDAGGAGHLRGPVSEPGGALPAVQGHGGAGGNGGGVRAADGADRGPGDGLRADPGHDGLLRGPADGGDGVGGVRRGMRRGDAP